MHTSTMMATDPNDLLGKDCKIKLLAARSGTARSGFGNI